jgi:3-oxoacyl-[acyl-carrier-protein] synthase-3
MATFVPLDVKVTATGLYAPPRVETAAELAPRVGKTEAWILERTGVSRRHIAEEPVERMGALAAKAALADGPPPDLLLYASATQRQPIPDTSVFVERELGLEGLPCYSVHATCLSFLVALHSAAALVAANAYGRILVVSSEIGSIARNFEEPESAVLLGDGAAAAVLEPTPSGESSKLKGYVLATYPRAADYAEIRGYGSRVPVNHPDALPSDHLFHMNGTRLFRLAMVHIGDVLERLFAQAGLKASDIDLVVPHQPSRGGLDSLARWGFPAERVVDILAEYGNCVAASLPMALATAHADGRLKRGHHVLLIGTGAGMSIGAAILEW